MAGQLFYGLLQAACAWIPLSVFLPDLALSRRLRLHRKAAQMAAGAQSGNEKNRSRPEGRCSGSRGWMR
jgi:hypothetical protein